MRFLAPLFHFDGMRVVQVCGLHVEETWAKQENYRNVSFVSTQLWRSLMLSCNWEAALGR